jgi:hypothetical protein
MLLSIAVRFVKRSPRLDISACSSFLCCFSSSSDFDVSSGRSTLDVNADVKREGNLDGGENSCRGEDCDTADVVLDAVVIGGVNGGKEMGGRCDERSCSFDGVGFKSEAIP